MTSKRARFGLAAVTLFIAIIGVIAALAIPRFPTASNKGKLAPLKSDLRNLASAEEAYRFEHGTYVRALALLRFSATGGSEVTVVSATKSGWAAIATQPDQTTQRCALFNGAVPPLTPATVEGLIACQ